MRQELKMLLFLVLAIIGASRREAGIVLPTGLALDMHYQLIFATFGMIGPTSADIGTYNEFVAAQAALNPALPPTTWHAVISTPTVNAKDNAPSPANTVVFNLQGITIAALRWNYGLYSGGSFIDGKIKYDQFGNGVFYSVWTGTDESGMALHPLGGDQPYGTGNPQSNPCALGGGDSFTKIDAPIYALSDVFTVPVPEPTTWVIGAAAG